MDEQFLRMELLFYTKPLASSALELHETTWTGHAAFALGQPASSLTWQVVCGKKSLYTVCCSTELRKPQHEKPEISLEAQK